MLKRNQIGVIDLFCGIGGLSYGLKQEGFDIIAYTHNNEAKFFATDITRVRKSKINKLFKGKKVRVLAGCAPCQPFSSYAFKNKEKDPNKYDLLYQFGRLVKETLPDIVTMENVPLSMDYKLTPVLSDVIS